MYTFANITTPTEIQRNYKRVSDRAKSLDDALIVMSNNKPELAVMGFGLYQSLIDTNMAIKKPHTKEKIGLDAVFGKWTKHEALEFNKIVDEMNERIDLED